MMMMMTNTQTHKQTCLIISAAKLIARTVEMTVDMEFARIHRELLKQGLFNRSVNWPHFQKRSI